MCKFNRAAMAPRADAILRVDGTGGYVGPVCGPPALIPMLRPGISGANSGLRAAQQGRTLQLWDVAISNEAGKLVAKGRVRLAIRALPAEGTG